MSDTTTKRYLRPSLSASKLGFSVATLWRLARTNPEFPKPIKVSPRVTVFDETELENYIARRRAAA